MGVLDVPGHANTPQVTDRTAKRWRLFDSNAASSPMKADSDCPKARIVPSAMGSPTTTAVSRAFYFDFDGASRSVGDRSAGRRQAYAGEMLTSSVLRWAAEATGAPEYPLTDGF